jgi:hypothetical protein
MKGLAAAKTAFDSVRSAISMVKDVQSLGGGTQQQQKAIDQALTIASSNTAIAEAQLAQAFGYELCKCEFPPIPMRTVGYFIRRHAGHNEGERCASSALAAQSSHLEPFRASRIAWDSREVAEPALDGVVKLGDGRRLLGLSFFHSRAALSASRRLAKN